MQTQFGRVLEQAILDAPELGRHPNYMKMTTSGHDEDFDKLASEFTQRYGDRRTVLKEYTIKVSNILDNGLKSGRFRAIPITWRMKTPESALDSIKRRQHARMKRQDLKERLEARNGNWEHYWTKRDMKYRINDVGPFRDCKTMIDNLHDIGGVRVCVYFPNDVDKVVAFLRTHKQVEIVRVLLHGQGTAPDMVELENHVEELEQKPRSDTADELSIRKSMFSGYRATHVHIKLVGDGIPEGHENSMHQNVVEVQIATVVMHAWSQIEHDIIYKPGAVEPSDQERLILDTFNGIVMTGESALRQLAECTERKENSRALEADSPAAGLYELGQWLTVYCQDKKVFFIDKNAGWNMLVHMFEILEARNEHTSGKVKALFNMLLAKGPDRKVFNQNLPLFLLREKCQQEQPSPDQCNEDMLKGVERKQSTAVIARIGALCVVHSLNMASYLGIEEVFLKRIQKILPEMSKRPSLIDFLDLVHPIHPRLNQAKEDSIIEFCDAFMKRDAFHGLVNEDDLELAKIELPIMLTNIGRVVFRRDDTHPLHLSLLTLVPRSLCVLLQDPEHSNWLPDLFSRATYLTKKKHRLLSTGYTMDFCGWEAYMSPSSSSSFLCREITTLNPNFERTFNYKPGKHVTLKGITTNGLSWLGNLITTNMPLPRSGYFKPNDNGTWEFIDSGLEQLIYRRTKWEVKHIKIFDGSSGPVIKKIQRESDFLDLARCLNPGGDFKFESVSQGGSKKYTFQFGGQPFQLIVEPDKFKLKRIAQEVEEESEQEIGMASGLVRTMAMPMAERAATGPDCEAAGLTNVGMDSLSSLCLANNSSHSQAKE